MNYRNFLLLLMFTIFSASFAQKKMVITLSGTGQKVTYNVWDVDNITFEDVNGISAPLTATAVDLGLSVQWSSFNFGAATENEGGYLLGWGDITGINHSTNLGYFPIASPSYNITAGDYDIAHKFWGGLWRLPTVDEFRELLNNCDWVIQPGAGYKVISRTNPNNSIFLPFAGKREGETTTESLTVGYYWTGNLGTTSNDNGVGFSISDATKTQSDYFRYMGLAIRPVYGQYTAGVSFSKIPSIINITLNSASAQFSCIGNLDNNTLEWGLRYATSADLLPTASDVKSTANILADGTYTMQLSNLNPNTTYYVQGYMIYNGNRIVSNVSTFTTAPKYAKAAAVDLGLSVKWASWNIGATDSTGYGGYFAWGDPTGESTSMTNANFPQISDIGGTQFDIATAQWGKDWRLPTPAEIVELGTLTKTLVSRNGVMGFAITSKDGKTELFLPLAGWKSSYSTAAVDVGSFAYVWLSSGASMDQANFGQMHMLNAESRTTDKVIRIPVRPVYVGDSNSTPVVPPTPLTAVGMNAQAVDLGLSVDWATYNVGATSETQPGSYLCWGETATKTNYVISEYKYYSTTTSTYTNIGNNITGTSYDAAYTLWGGTWRMPTNAEINELISNCTWTWDDTKKGSTVTSRTTGKSIFLYAGGMYSGTILSQADTNGYYWTSNADQTDTELRCGDLTFTSTASGSIGRTYRYKGLLIRPVRTK